jgi:hypothetical protein
VVPLIKTGAMLQLTHSMKFYLPKAELVTTISHCQWNSASSFFFLISLLFGVNSSLKNLPLGLLISPHSSHCEKETHVVGALKYNPKMQLYGISVFWNALTLCPAKYLFFFFPEVTS